PVKCNPARESHSKTPMSGRPRSGLAGPAGTACMTWPAKSGRGAPTGTTATWFSVRDPETPTRAPHGRPEACPTKQVLDGTMAQQGNSWLRTAVVDCFDRTIPHPSPVRGERMKKRKWLALAMGLAALVAVGGFVATGRIPAVAEEQSARDKKQ